MEREMLQEIAQSGEPCLGLHLVIEQRTDDLVKVSLGGIYAHFSLHELQQLVARFPEPPLHAWSHLSTV